MQMSTWSEIFGSIIYPVPLLGFGNHFCDFIFNWPIVFIFILRLPPSFLVIAGALIRMFLATTEKPTNSGSSRRALLFDMVSLKVQGLVNSVIQQYHRGPCVFIFLLYKPYRFAVFPFLITNSLVVLDAMVDLDQAWALWCRRQIMITDWSSYHGCNVVWLGMHHV